VKDPSNIPGSTAGSGATPSTSPSLLDGLRQRDPDAWRCLALLYGPLVYRWCRVKGLREPDCEDVVQEVLLTVVNRVADFRREQEGGTFRGWLWTITRHKLGDWLRRQRKQEQAAGGTDAQERLAEAAIVEAEEPEPADDGSLCRRALDLVRSEFTEISFQAFWRVTVLEESPADVAADLGLSRNAVYIARSRILGRLRELLGEV
jgi:RNA polymerase sigma-70 factor (ECF subfamily)